MENYTYSQTIGQEAISNISLRYLKIPSDLPGFINTDTIECGTKTGRRGYRLAGKLQEIECERVCKCGSKLHIHNQHPITLRHLNFGAAFTSITFPHIQYICPNCGLTKMQDIPFKAKGHMITSPLKTYVEDLLFNGATLKSVSQITGLGQNVVKAIDKERLKKKYLINGKLKKPETTAKILGIDEFKLHDGYKYATHIIDMRTGHILWISEGKKKQVVYDFIEFVGMKWMGNVEAVACDMNSDFQSAFQEKCEWIQPVFDYFHIVQNFNEHVISSVRKDEQQRLLDEGRSNEAKALKGSKYILTSSRETLQKKDDEAKEGKLLRKGSEVFRVKAIERTAGHVERYNQLLKENKLFFTIDLVKEKLKAAYATDNEAKMAEEISAIIEICKATKNRHFYWFGRLLFNHFEGIIAHATYHITSGKVEGINNKIKTIRRQGYGYPDDEYFFLKLFDASRHKYEKNIPSQKLLTDETKKGTPHNETLLPN